MVTLHSVLTLSQPVIVLRPVFLFRQILNSSVPRNKESVTKMGDQENISGYFCEQMLSFWVALSLLNS